MAKNEKLSQPDGAASLAIFGNSLGATQVGRNASVQHTLKTLL